MDEKYLTLAVPFFIVSMLGEAWYARRSGKRLYRMHDTVGSLACGIGQTLLGFWINIVVIAVYAWVAKAAPHPLDGSSTLVWVGSLVGVDFLHYWFHRSSHRVNFLWAGHAVHHQSEDYNLSTALRQSWLEPLFSLPFYLPLALVGVPVEVFLATHTLQTLYQYWIHTRAIDKLGPFDLVFNTPTNHRVHHAINPEYIDKNYAGILILWDRIFGTWVPEEAEPAYGLVKPVASFNPFWVNLSEWARIAALSYGSKTTSEAMFAPFAPPEWLPRAMGGPKEVPPVDPDRKLYDTRPGKATDTYVSVAFALVLLATGALLGVIHTVDPAWRAGWIVWLLLALGTLPGMLEAKRWSITAEKIRLGLAPVLLGGVLGIPGWIGGAVFTVLSLWLGGAALSARPRQA